MKGLSHVEGSRLIPLLSQTIGEKLKETVEKFPEAPALIVRHQNFAVTYKEFWEHTTQVAKALMKVGIERGDRVGIWAPNRYEWVLLQFATARIGVILVNINPAYKAQELKYVLNQSGIKYLISANRFKTSNYVEIAVSVKEECPALERIVFLDDEWFSFLSEADSVSEEQLSEREKSIHYFDPVNIQYTSGTTGFPKGVTLSHHNILNNGYFIGKRLNYSEKDKVCIPVPFYHCFGMVIGNLACICHGAAMVIPGDSFDPQKTLQTVSDEWCTSLYGVPTMFIAMLDVPDLEKYDVTSLRTGVMAGSPCPIEIMRKVKTTLNMPEVSVCYGMTETSPVSTQTVIGTPIEKQVSTVGTVQDHLEIKIINAFGETVPIGEKGEICTKGYSVMLYYWNDEAHTRQVKDEEGWMHTGDEGYMDEEGYITITGRIKDIIIRGGENISPKEIEDLLYKHPVILEVQVIGVPDAKFGEEIMAWVKLKEGHDFVEEELVIYCKSNLAHFKTPKYWKLVDAFPMTITGKIQKNIMRQISTEELGLLNPES